MVTGLECLALCDLGRVASHLADNDLDGALDLVADRHLGGSASVRVSGGGALQKKGGKDDMVPSVSR